MVLIEPDIKFTRIVPVLLKILAVNPCPVHIMPLKKKKKKMLGQLMENVMWALYCHPGF